MDFRHTVTESWPLYLASGSADSSIRVWLLDEISTSTSSTKNATRENVPANGEGRGGEGDEGLVRRPKEVLNFSVKRYEFTLGVSTVCAQLEAVLLGHEDRVHCLRWRRQRVGFEVNLLKNNRKLYNNNI